MPDKAPYESPNDAGPALRSSNRAERVRGRLLGRAVGRRRHVQYRPEQWRPKLALSMLDQAAERRRSCPPAAEGGYRPGHGLWRAGPRRLQAADRLADRASA